MPTVYTNRPSVTTNWTGRPSISIFGSYLTDYLGNYICDYLGNRIIVQDPNGNITFSNTTWTGRTLI